MTRKQNYPVYDAIIEWSMTMVWKEKKIIAVCYCEEKKLMKLYDVSISLERLTSVKVLTDITVGLYRSNL